VGRADRRTTDAAVLAFAKALFAELPRCTGCDFAHGWDDHVLAVAAAHNVHWWGSPDPIRAADPSGDAEARR
jgi:hypothetical protein